MSFHPPKRTLMGPGPSDVDPRISEALGRPTIGHLDPEFIRLMDETKTLLQYAFMTNNELTLPISAPGSAGMEACFVNLIEAGDKGYCLPKWSFWKPHERERRALRCNRRNGRRRVGNSN